MDVLKRDDLTKNLILVLKKMTELKKYDSIYTEKFLDSITKEFSNMYEIIQAPEFSEWVSETFQKWKQTNPNVTEAIFILKFLRVLAKNEQGFQLILNLDVLINLTNLLQSDAFKQSDFEPIYVTFLSDILTHAAGYEWVKNTQQWKTVCQLYFSNTNLYVEREGLNFLKTFISKVILDYEGSKETHQQIFLILNSYKDINVKDQKLCSVTILFLNLIQSILEPQIFFMHAHLFIELIKVFDLQLYLNSLLENCKQDIILEKASILLVVLFVFQYEDKKELLDSENLFPILDPFYVMLQKNQYNGLIKLAKYCQVLWNEMRKRFECESQTGIQFIAVQLWPVLMCIKPNTDSCNAYLQKLFSLVTISTQKFCSLLNDEIESNVCPKPKNLALKGIILITGNTDCLNSEEALTIFQTMSFILISFSPDNSCWSWEETSLCAQDTAILSAVLNSLCVFIEKFKIKWSESLENFCLLKITRALIENPNSPPVIVVQLFSLLKLAILNFTLPILPFSTNNIKNCGFDCLMSLLYKRLHDPNWEIRDSCLEVVTAIAELHNPAFEQLLMEKKFYSLVFDIMEGDSESYVRASAIQTLTAMIKIEALKDFLISLDVSHKIIQLLQNESEAIVRREAALMIKQLYLAQSDSNNEITSSFYEVMGYSAICDLHWEVKLNSLIFWETVIKHIISDHGMINDFVPKVAFSEENQASSKLSNILSKLSETGCLYVLLSALNDDCDMPVIRKSAQILSQLMCILEQYGVNELFKDIPVRNRIPTKRKITDLDSYEKRKSVMVRNNCDDLGEINATGYSNEEPVNSDVVIDEILNEKDINLLGVCFQKEPTNSPQKKILLQEVKPETFLSQMQNFNIEKFVEEKKKWLINVEVDFKTILLEAFTENQNDETNVMDCY